MEEAERGWFSTFQADRLCAGSFSTAPADCGNLATHYLTTEQAVTLCTFAQSNAPINCASEANRLPLSSTQILTLCNQAQNNGPADCAFSARQLNIFSGDQIVTLCFGSVDMTPAACASMVFTSTRSSPTALTSCRAIQPQNPIGLPIGPGPLPFPNPLPNPIPGGGGGTGTFTSCVLTTGVGSYQGIGFTEGQATAAARDQCLQVESVVACNGGHTTCH